MKRIKISEIELNKGQVEGLPKNPRFIRDNRFAKLVKSIEDAPEFIEYRPLLVYPHNGKYITIGGNMRLRACKDLKWADVPCEVLPANTPVEKLREYTIKDNNGFGEDDWDLLANEWDAIELDDWGMEIDFNESEKVNADEFGTEFELPSGDKDPFQQMAFNLADAQAEQVKNAIEEVKKTEEYKYVETFGNTNTNGNALYLIIMQWADAKK